MLHNTMFCIDGNDDAGDGGALIMFLFGTCVYYSTLNVIMLCPKTAQRKYQLKLCLC